MFRKQIATAAKRPSDSVRWRGHEVTRIEAFSDAIFAFGITLLIVALEVPETYTQLMESMKFFLPFAICFIILFMIWFAQNIFFRRYGLHDTYTVVLNGVLLFLVLFFVYPLKFLFGSIFSGHFHIDTVQEAANLFYIYGSGFIGIYLIFALMYHNALRMATHLELTTVEKFDTRSHLYSYLIIASTGVVSMVFAFLGGLLLNFAGPVYALIGPGVGIMYTLRAKKRKKIAGKLVAEPVPVVEDDMPGN